MVDPNPSASHAPYKIYNIGHNSPVKLLQFIETLGLALGKPVAKNFLPMQKGDVVATYANIDALHALTGYQPKVGLAQGLEQWAAWYKWYQAR
jgi:UDP-glucuronate 4-epimerase